MREVRKTANQVVKEQIENRINLIAEIDSAINEVCKKVKNDKVMTVEYAQTVKALADLVIARAFL